jgi:hypothetical protein
MPAPYTGGCQCGSVRYVLTTEPIRLAACRCKECQRQSGSAFGMSMPVKKDSLTVAGLTKQVTRIADSGNEVTGVFCPECGVRIYHVLKPTAEVLSLKPGTLDDTRWLGPDHFVWMKSAQGGFLSPTASQRFRDRLSVQFCRNRVATPIFLSQVCGRSAMGLNELPGAETASLGSCRPGTFFSTAGSFLLRAPGRSEPALNAPSPEDSFVRRLYQHDTCV